MLRLFSVKNYKNFKDEITLDFTNVANYDFGYDCINNYTIAKMLVFGRNATGKTNLGRAIVNFATMTFGDINHMKEDIVNANSKENRIDFHYVFQIEGKELAYNYSIMNDRRLLAEKLTFENDTVFSFGYDEREYQYEKLEIIGAEPVNVERYLHITKKSLLDMSFIRWLNANTIIDEDSIFSKMISFAKGMVFRVASPSNMNQYLLYEQPHFYKELYEKENGCEHLEQFLNYMGVECMLKLVKHSEDYYQLYFDFDTSIPFQFNSSSGTKSLLLLYRMLFIDDIKPTFIYLDEFDAYYHYELAQQVVGFFKKELPDCQVVFSTHNTNLMTTSLVRPDCVFILSERGTLTSLTNATTSELKEGHNLEKMYISGEFMDYE